MFEGVLPALVTPFLKDGSVDSESFKNIVNFVEEGGVSGVVVCGTTGESATLETREHKELINLCVDCAKVPVIAGTGSNNTAEAVELTKHAADAGADGALIISPYYIRPNNAGLIAHFKKIAEASDIPIVLYNVPSRTGQDMPLEVIVELSKVENIVAVKEASGSLGKFSQIIEETADEDFEVLSGEDGLTFPSMAIGGAGVISVVANIVPAKMVQLAEAVKASDLETARRIHFEVAPLIRALFTETNPIPVKRAVELIGLSSGDMRLPLAPLSDENSVLLENVLRKMGCIA
ncbi:MAG: 4-hydroxy-tetrahydrodipicolinate synthase [Methanolobus sp.]|jgi:4-hydroxy-tetrahydrodipicolinate synthase|uniref:4-hydroxy-tetrahydrodipicolinate synthase n=1 Tax=Methanolobus tindarius DSM 2278 TaxID=1090322 RepID=W9DYA6_METTI|nr:MULTISPECIES: 4-hydroxy-tetrahydrodipicolinate synthase [Methanolobus]ETA68391.1 dihydrodipicolinate synthase [Methanolobus tindarius DSM 2278]MDI3485541.1 4-hydroxy-tetrahydrodipicolinate synthase [Methanolobus sp.]MDK2832350.1 4-hydroxy-tetrahydrodipicolinate synthase [Methanolobus sp.]MDK2938815.1 4-hydroxy-tetrahydrodipicolinate synthase [Methanolobus sp.]